MMRAALAAAVALSAALAHAHKPSDSYLTLAVKGAGLEGRWDVSLRDLQHAIGLDLDQDGAITWGELKAKRAEIAAYMLSHLDVRADGAACQGGVGEQRVVHHSDGAYAVLGLAFRCAAAPSTLAFRYRPFFDLDPQHRGLLRFDAAGGTQSAIFSTGERERRLEVAGGSAAEQLFSFGRQGVWHIWIGFDHILFLLALLLPAVLRREGGRWQAAFGFRAAFVDVLKIVTAFTIAHSITLTLAALELLSLPSQWIESAIAASVVLAAVNNLFPMFQGQRWVVAFGLGLLHGFGFSNALADLGLPQESLVLTLVGFNLGVEVGQLAVVGAFLPLAFWIRHTWVYQRLTLVGGSAAIAAIAAIWLVERISSTELLSI